MPLLHGKVIDSVVKLRMGFFYYLRKFWLARDTLYFKKRLW